MTNVQRHPSHIEFACERTDVFGSVISYLFVLFETPQPVDENLVFARRQAERSGQVLVTVAVDPGEKWLSWVEFIEALGGAVPVWRALTPEFPDLITILGRNILPDGLTGEPWRLFEEAVADGLTFALGHRVRRLGGRMRGEPVSDMVARTPDDKILVIDAKASAKDFDVGVETLRPLKEYVQRQQTRQKGDLSVNAVILAANTFRQDEQRLQELSGEFLADTRIPLTYLPTATLVEMVHRFENTPHLRNKLQWAKILCRGGIVHLSYFVNEVDATMREYMGRR